MSPSSMRPTNRALRTIDAATETGRPARKWFPLANTVRLLQPLRPSQIDHRQPGGASSSPWYNSRNDLNGGTNTVHRNGDRGVRLHWCVFLHQFLCRSHTPPPLAGTPSSYIWIRSVPPQTGRGPGRRFTSYIRIGTGSWPGSHLLRCRADRRSAPTHPRTCRGRYDPASDSPAQAPVVPGAAPESCGSRWKRGADSEGAGQTSRPLRPTSRQALFQFYPLISIL